MTKSFISEKLQKYQGRYAPDTINIAMRAAGLKAPCTNGIASERQMEIFIEQAKIYNVIEISSITSKRAARAAAKEVAKHE
jgi:hypothetical protein